MTSTAIRRAPSSVGRPVDFRHVARQLHLIATTTGCGRAIVTATGCRYAGDGYAVPMLEHADAVADVNYPDTVAAIADWVETAAHAVMTVATPARYFAATLSDTGHLILSVVQLFSSADWDSARRAAVARGIAEVHHTGPDTLVPVDTL